MDGGSAFCWILSPVVHHMSKAVGVMDSVPSGPSHVKGCGCAGLCPQWSTTRQRLWVCWILSPVVHYMSKAVGVMDSAPSGPPHVKGCGGAGFCPQWSITCQRLWVCWILSLGVHHMSKVVGVLDSLPNAQKVGTDFTSKRDPHQPGYVYNRCLDHRADPYSCCPFPVRLCVFSLSTQIRTTLLTLLTCYVLVLLKKVTWCATSSGKCVVPTSWCVQIRSWFRTPFYCACVCRLTWQHYLHLSKIEYTLVRVSKDCKNRAGTYSHNLFCLEADFPWMKLGGNLPLVHGSLLFDICHGKPVPEWASLNFTPCRHLRPSLGRKHTVTWLQSVIIISDEWP